MTLDAGRYLRRTAWGGPIHADARTLAGLHAAHLRQIPFENLDIHLGRPIRLDLDHLWRKIVDERRGGFCYELNGLFAWLLGELGFHVTLLSARVARPDGSFSPEFDHLALRVDVPGGTDGERSWIADVGFGDSFLEPLPLEPGRAVEQGPAGFRLDADGDGLRLVRRGPDGVWRPQYAFALRGRALQDFEPRCLYQQQAPDSHFRQHAMATVATLEGRVTVSDDRLIATRGALREERAIEDAAALGSLLARHFGIELDAAQVGRLAARWGTRPP
jgi:N-hydroxyarylamine O-acetyltransferase